MNSRATHESFPLNHFPKLLLAFVFAFVVCAPTAAQETCYDTCPVWVCDTGQNWVPDYCQDCNEVCDTGWNWVEDTCQSCNWTCDTGWNWVDEYCDSCNEVCDTCTSCWDECDEWGCWTVCSDYSCNCRTECSSYVCGGHWETYEDNCRNECSSYGCNGRWEPYQYNCRTECSSYECGGHWENYETNCRWEEEACNPHPCSPPPPTCGCAGQNDPSRDADGDCIEGPPFGDDCHDGDCSIGGGCSVCDNNGSCEYSENHDNCPGDCPAPPACGCLGQNNPFEDADGDCIAGPPFGDDCNDGDCSIGGGCAVCDNNDICEYAETHQSCPSDCTDDPPPPPPSVTRTWTFESDQGVQAQGTPFNPSVHCRASISVQGETFCPYYHRLVLRITDEAGAELGSNTTSGTGCSLENNLFTPVPGAGSYTCHLEIYGDGDALLHQASRVEVIAPQVPSFLEEIDVQNRRIPCDELGFQSNLFEAFVTQIRWEVLDQRKLTIAKAGQVIAENNVPSGGSCNAGAPANVTWGTDAGGRTVIPDYIFNCLGTCATGGNCQANWNQSLTVDTRSVQICPAGCLSSWPTNTWSTSCTNYPVR